MSKARNLADVGSDTDALTTDTELGNYVGPEGFFVPALASDPTNAVAGQLYYSTSDNIIKHYDGSNWLKMSNKFDAIGGDIIDSYTVEGVEYIVHTFTSSGTFIPSDSGFVDILLVGGGGGGATAFNRSACGGGGGGGAVRAHLSVAVSPVPYAVLIGAGGAAGTGTSLPYDRTVPGVGDGEFGGDSSALGMVANGGGTGTCYEDRVGFSNGNASAGGSGGAGGLLHSSGSTYPQGGVYGNNGGLQAGTGQSNDSTSAGGGGGAGGAGGNGVANSQGGAGGIGLQNEFQTGSIQYYGGGGGGGSSKVGSAPGGLGGGGTAGAVNAVGSPGTANTGGGGGGGSSTTGYTAGGNGGSGIVIIRYLAP